MLGGVLVLRIVAAAHVPALATQAQAHPGVAHLEALLTAVRTRPARLHCPEVATGHPMYFSTTLASRARAFDGSSPNSRKARRCRSKSQYLSSWVCREARRRVSSSV